MSTEVIWAIRRTDGEPIGGEYSFMVVSGPGDWDAAIADAEYSDEPIEYELIGMRVVSGGVRTYPRCTE